MNEKLRFWLETAFQNSIEVALQLSRSQAPEETPFVHKYKAIQILKQLLLPEHEFKFIPLCVLADLYNQVEQLGDSARTYYKSLQELTKVPQKQVGKFANYLVITLNMLGLSYINRQQLQEGMGCLIQANRVYQQFQLSPGKDVCHYRHFPAKGRQFKFLYEGGVDHEQMEDAHTLTLFYLAQAYTKQGLRQKAAQLCGKTLQRQYSTGKYELKEFVQNLVGLAQYFQGSKQFSQAQYLYMLALKVIPQGKKKKLKASVHVSIGNLIGQILSFSCRRIQQKQVLESDNLAVSKQVLLFKEFDQAFPNTVLPVEIQGCKSLFRQANTQFKKALQVFVLDGFVTQHIDILSAQSQLYKSLSLLQTSVERKASMLDKRRELLQPLMKQLNPKVYPATWQKILVQVAQIINDLFNLRVAVLSAKGIPSEEKISHSRQLGKRAIGYYKQIIQTLQSDKQAQRNQHFFRGVVNSKINVAKATSKLMSSDRKERVGYLRDSLRLYEDIIRYINKDIPQNQQGQFGKELQLTRDMIAMLPSKIDKVNYGQMVYLD